MTENLYLKLPLVGPKRTEEFETRIRGTNRREKRTSESSVLGVEDITSSAGAYQAFKIETNHWCGGRSCGRYIYFSSLNFSPIEKNKAALRGIKVVSSNSYAKGEERPYGNRVYNRTNGISAIGAAPSDGEI